jgi:hypothetical protein
MLLALAAASACAAPRITAKPSFSPLRSTDWGGVVVLVENDAVARSAELVLVRTSGGRGDSKSGTRLPLELGALARREVILPLPPGMGTDCRVDLLAADQVLASAVARVEWARNDRRLVGCIGEAPASLVAACRRDLDVPLVEIDPKSLPGNEIGWPHFDVIAWPSPRSTDLDAAQAAALRRHVRAGGRLVLGAIHEDVDVLERLGIADIAPAKLSAGEGLEVIAVPNAEATATDDAMARAAGLGTVLLVPRDLARGEVAWLALLGIEPPPKDDDAGRRGWRQQPAQDSLVRIYPPPDLLEELTPHAPTWLAATLLGACLLAAVPLDAWLTRRTLKRGRRSRFGWTRYPAILLATTVLAYLLADRVGARDVVVSRIDVVDVREPEGAAMGRSLLIFTRGRSGSIDLDGESAQWTALGRLGGMSEDARIDASWLPSADRDALLSRASFDLESWQVVLAEARWVPDPARVPHAQAPTADQPVHVPASLAAGIETPTGFYPLQDERCVVRDVILPKVDGIEGEHLLVALDQGGEGPSRRVRIVQPGSFGPSLRVGGVEARPERTFTLIRYAFNEDATRILTDCWPENPAK